MNDRQLAAAGLVLVLAGGWWLWRSRDSAAGGDESAGRAVSVTSLGSFGLANLYEVGVDLVETATRAVSGSGWDIPARGDVYRAAIYAAEDRHGIPRLLLARLLHQESRFRADIINGETVSSAGALGIAQFMPATARDMGINPLDPYAAIDAAGRYLRQLHNRFGDWSLALAAYNWGQGNLARKGFESAPEETRNYVAEITADVPLA